MRLSAPKKPSAVESSDSVTAPQSPPKPAKPYWLYLLECKGGSYYTGIALDIEQRFEKHAKGKGAAYTRANPPLRVMAATKFPNKSDALKAEFAVKQLPKGRKVEFFAERERGG
jgi:putative endonuclease